jgi:hypothetical protein
MAETVAEILSVSRPFDNGPCQPVRLRALLAGLRPEIAAVWASSTESYTKAFSSHTKPNATVLVMSISTVVFAAEVEREKQPSLSSPRSDACGRQVQSLSPRNHDGSKAMPSALAKHAVYKLRRNSFPHPDPDHVKRLDVGPLGYPLLRRELFDLHRALAVLSSASMSCAGTSSAFSLPSPAKIGGLMTLLDSRVSYALVIQTAFIPVEIRVVLQITSSTPRR